MISIKNTFSFLFLAASSFGVNAASIPAAHEEAAGAATAGEPYSDPDGRFDRETKLLSQMGQCRSYEGWGIDERFYLPDPAPCMPYCRGLTGKESTMCLLGKHDAARYQDPYQKGKIYVLGAKCTCITMPREIEDLIRKGLGGLNVVTCTVWVTSARLVVDYGMTAVPGGKAALEAMKRVAGVVQRLSKSGVGKDAWYKALKKTFGTQGVKVQDDMKKAFDIWVKSTIS
ncbi:hypothetical protein LX32DRAFT_650083 [Colletotrichum zoysiae]|uniref:Secreted protein n=1 Tax=Colletotrichum zoysiae TaxID=1216348 RepID=A0AAD9M2Z0_9PEZI|nr:hypothetical protein LX32DRAFT_650083 [Colletotrichum zoysiae]